MVRRRPESEIYSEPASGVTIDLKIVVEDCINQLEAQGAQPRILLRVASTPMLYGRRSGDYLTGVTAKSNHQYFKLMHYRIVSGESHAASTRRVGSDR